MVRVTLLVGFALLCTGPAAFGQENPACSATRMSIDSLRGMASRLYPDTKAPSQAATFKVVVLIFDAECRLLHHGQGERLASTSLGTIRRIVPETADYPFASLGVANLLERATDSSRRPAPWDDGSPLVAWAIRERSGG